MNQQWIKPAWKRRLPLLLVILAGSALPAQEDEPPRDVSFELRTVWSSSALDPGESMPESVALDYRDGEEWTSLEINYSTQSGPYRYRGPSPMRLLLRETGADGEIVRRPAFQVNVPEGLKKAILFVLPVPDDRFAAQFVDTSRENIGPGKILVANFSTDRATATTTRDRVLVPPGENRVMPLVIDGYYLKFQVAVEDGERWKSISTRKHALAPDSRALFLLYRREIASGPWKVSLIRLPAGTAE